MNKVLSFLLCLIFAYNITAQESLVNKAEKYLKEGALDEALKTITKAESNNKTNSFYKTFYIKGKIYTELHIVDNENIMCDNCIFMAAEAYLRSLQLNLVDKKFVGINLYDTNNLLEFSALINQREYPDFTDTASLNDILDNQLILCFNKLRKIGFLELSEKKYEASYKNLSMAFLLDEIYSKSDTNLYYVLAQATFGVNKYKETLTLTDKLLACDSKFSEEDMLNIYHFRVIAFQQLGENQKMLDILEKGLNKFPKNNYVLLVDAFNYYINKNEPSITLGYLNRIIEINPYNPSFYVNRGLLLESQEKFSDAILSYEKALSVQPANFDANYCLGACYYNMGIDTLAWADKNINITDREAYEKYNIIFKDYFSQALPYLEAAYLINPNNLVVAESLKTVYYRLGMMEKYNELNK